MLAKSVDAVRIFVAPIGHLAFAPEGMASESTHGDVPAKVETLAYYLFPFFGASNNRTIIPAIRLGTNVGCNRIAGLIENCC